MREIGTLMTRQDDLRLNAMLGMLPPDDFQLLDQHLEIVDVEIRDSVYEPGGPIRDIYFPLDSVFSLVAVVDDRIAVEVATTGREGMVGLPVLLGALASPHSAFCQISGRAGRLSAEHLRDVLSRDGALHRALNRFTQSIMVQIAQNVVCNAAHAGQQRAARWLLTTHDRIGRDNFDLTQEFLAQMLGMRRPTVSDIAQRLQDAGLIRYTRGQMSIVDRAGLERTSCECYEIVRRDFDGLVHGAKPPHNDLNR